MKDEVVARLYTPVMYVECPKCENDFNLFDDDESYETATSEDGEPLAWKLFNGWYNKKEYELEVTCQQCEHKFTVREVEY